MELGLAVACRVELLELRNPLSEFDNRPLPRLRVLGLPPLPDIVRPLIDVRSVLTELGPMPGGDRLADGFGIKH